MLNEALLKIFKEQGCFCLGLRNKIV